ncbi:unnamed protein product [Symbiodinium sp. CCMP2592]|nr:unnamed protein product [Symbiodinium sp. CCMP2592]
MKLQVILLRQLQTKEMLLGVFEGFVRRVREDQPSGHEPEEIPQTEMDLSFESDAQKDEDEDPNLEAKQAAKEWAHRRYEDVPPELTPECLSRLDAAMDQLEVKRLLAIGVVRKLGDSQQGGHAPEGMKSRLVAKEYRFLAPELEHLYAAASMAVLQRVFAGLCGSGENLVLYSVDVSDAYLQVPQSCPTCIVSNDGEYLELLYSLPGQRDAARGWYLHFKEIVKGNRLKPFEGAPAVFHEKGKIPCNSHVDDLHLCGGNSPAQELLDSLKKSGLRVKVEGPVRIDGGECRVLKRLFMGDGSGILVDVAGCATLIWPTCEYQLGHVIERVITTNACPHDIGLKGRSGKARLTMAMLLTDSVDGAKLDSANHMEPIGYLFMDFLMAMMVLIMVVIFVYFVFSLSKVYVYKENTCFRIFVFLLLFFFFFQADALKYTITIEIDGQGCKLSNGCGSQWRCFFVYKFNGWWRYVLFGFCGNCVGKCGPRYVRGQPNNGPNNTGG